MIFFSVAMRRGRGPTTVYTFTHCLYLFIFFTQAPGNNEHTNNYNNKDFTDPICIRSTVVHYSLYTYNIHTRMIYYSTHSYLT